METREIVAKIMDDPDKYSPDIQQLAQQWDLTRARLAMAIETLRQLLRWIDPSER